jgi:hypothetical protein
VADLSGTGFSLEEDINNSVLIPGMIVPELELRFADNFKAKCMSQVVYRRIISTPNSEETVRCGLAVLDMASEDHVRILSLLQQAKDRHSYLCAKVDMDQLWNFFFETGFIYPKKYAFIQANKEKIKSTYEKLYTLNPRIARHFIFQNKGVILGHMAMLRFYENAWLIHHHAAKKSESTRAGLAVLDQIGRYVHDSHRLSSIHMDYVFCYFRPDNRFPNRVFGGAAKKINNLKVCSLDSFAYSHFQKSQPADVAVPEAWDIADVSTSDLLELESFYEYVSGGLMINALDLETNLMNANSLTQEYAKLGFKKERHLFSIRKSGDLKAVCILNLSDIGLNMSDLTNCIKVIVLDQEELSKEILTFFISRLIKYFAEEEVPVLIYPLAYAKNHSFDYEKVYNLWILNPQPSDDYWRYLSKLVRVVRN